MIKDTLVVCGALGVVALLGQIFPDLTMTMVWFGLFGPATLLGWIMFWEAKWCFTDRKLTDQAKKWFWARVSIRSFYIASGSLAAVFGGLMCCVEEGTGNFACLTIAASLLFAHGPAHILYHEFHYRHPSDIHLSR